MLNTDNKPVILDVGCANNKVPGTVGIDIDPNSAADIIHDLNVYPYPIESNSVDKVYAKHIIEHVDNPRAFVNELHRIIKVGGTVFFETPHFSCRVAYSEPEHKFFFSYFMFVELLKGIDCGVVKQEITFARIFRNLGIKALANKWPDTYERFWTYMFPAENVKLEIRKTIAS